MKCLFRWGRALLHLCEACSEAVRSRGTRRTSKCRLPCPSIPQLLGIPQTWGIRGSLGLFDKKAYWRALKNRGLRVWPFAPGHAWPGCTRQLASSFLIAPRAPVGRRGCEASPETDRGLVSSKTSLHSTLQTSLLRGETLKFPPPAPPSSSGSGLDHTDTGGALGWPYWRGVDKS